MIEDIEDYLADMLRCKLHNLAGRRVSLLPAAGVTLSILHCVHVCMGITCIWLSRHLYVATWHPCETMNVKN